MYEKSQSLLTDITSHEFAYFVFRQLGDAGGEWSVLLYDEAAVFV